MEIGEPRSETKIPQVLCALGLLSNKAQLQAQDSVWDKRTLSGSDLVRAVESSSSRNAAVGAMVWGVGPSSSDVGRWVPQALDCGPGALGTDPLLCENGLLSGSVLGLLNIMHLESFWKEVE